MTQRIAGILKPKRLTADGRSRKTDEPVKREHTGGSSSRKRELYGARSSV